MNAVQPKIRWQGDLSDVSAALEILTAVLGVETIDGSIAKLAEETGGQLPGEKVLNITLTHEGSGFAIDVQANRASLRFGDKPSLFRALSYLASYVASRHDTDSPYYVAETRCFDTLSAMADASRNAVPTVATLKELLCRMALMGFNQLMIYMEDTFEIPGHPYFGYMRGRYSQAELKEIDAFADLLGIELVPCIQTLAHVPRVLQWQQYGPIADTPEILLAGEDKTYAFIDEMIASLSSCFRSKNIHIGMDEAYLVGLGEYLRRHGSRNRFEILNEHLVKVMEITSRYGLSPIMWSDMYFHLIDPRGDYAADSIPDEVAQGIPDGIRLMYWDYYSTDKALYLKRLHQHQAMRPGTMFAGGIWVWNGFAVSYNKSWITTLPALAACKQEGVRDVMATLWGDDGSETHAFQALLGLQLFAEVAYGMDADSLKALESIENKERLRTRFRTCTGGDADAFFLLDRIDNINDNAFNDQAVNTSKLALYQDPLAGLFDRHFQGLGLGAHYADLAARFRNHARTGDPWCRLFVPMAALCDLLSVKAELGIEIKSAYDSGDRKGLAAMLPRIEACLELTREFRTAYLSLYARDFKPFGIEVADIKLGGVLVRLENAFARISDYLAGRLESLPEVEADRLFHDCRDVPGKDTLVRFNRWHRTVTTSYMGHNVP